MIVLNIECKTGHRFEGWFASVDAFDEQVRKQMVNCPHCNSASVSRLPSGPHVARHAPAPVAALDPDVAKLVWALRNLADGSEDVGERFPEEARRIHHHEAPVRQIRGIASPEEAIDLIDEGIPVLPVPPKEETH